MPRRKAASPLPAVKVFYQGAPLALTPAGEGDYLWALQREDGECLQGASARARP